MSQSTMTHLQPLPTAKSLPVDSAERLQALYDLDLLDTPPEANFDRLTAFACRLLNTSVSLVSLVDKDRQFFKSSHGLGEAWASRQETPLSHSFCQYVVSSSAPLIVEDAREDEILRDNLAIADLNVVAYLGVPLFTEEGYVVGSLCAIEGKPRIWTPEELQTLQDLAALVMTEIRTRQYLKHQGEAREQLLKTNALLQGIIDSTGDGISVRDTQNRYLLVNRASAELVGMSAEEMIGKTYNELFPPEIAAQIEAEDRKTLETGKASRTEYTWQLGKTTKIFDSTRYAYRDSQGNIIGILGVSHDISELKETVQELRLMQMAIDHIADSVMITRANPLNPSEPEIVYVNPGFTAITGYSLEDVVGKTSRFLQGPKTSRSAIDQIRQALLKPETIRVELTNYRKNGTTFENGLTIVPIFDANGVATHFVSVQNDITEQKQTERHLQESELKFRSLFETMTQGVAYQNADGKITDANAAAQTILGLSLDQMQGRKSMDPRWRATRVDGSDFPGDEHPAMVALRTGEVQNNVDIYIFNAVLNEARCLRVDAIPQFRKGETTPFQVFTVFRDVTEQQRNNEQLAYHAGLFDNMHDAVIATDENLYISAWNRGAEQMYGWLASEAIGKPSRNIVRTQISEQERQAIVHELKTNGRYRMETITLHKDGSPLPTESITVSLQDSIGQQIGYLTINRDIGERKAAEAALQQSMALVQQQLVEIETLYATTPIGLAVLDRDLHYIRINNYLAANNGYSVEEHIGHTGAELIPEIAAQLDPLLRNVIATGEPVINLEVSGSTSKEPDLVRTWLESFYPLRDPSGRISAVNIVVQEITERKQIEEALHQSTQQLRLITDNVPGLIAYIDRQECYRFVNAAYERWYNKPREQILGHKLSDFIHPDTYKIAQPYITEALGGKTATFEVETSRHGSTTAWLMKYTPQIMDDGSVPGFYTLIMDITDRKEAEAALLESEERFRVIFEQAAVGMAECDLNGNFVRVNNCLCEILGYSREELLEKEMHVLTHPDDLAHNQLQMQRILDGDCDSYNLEKRYQRKDGTYLWVKVTVSLVKKLKTHEPDYFVRVIEDISEQKQYEQALEELNATLEQRVATRSKQLQTSNSKLLESESKLRQLSQQLMEMTEQERKRISREIHDQLGQSLTALKMEVKGAQRRFNTHPHETLVRLDAANKLIDETVDTVRRIAADLRPGVLDHFGLGPAVEWLMAQFKERNQIDYELDIKLQPEKITPDMATAAFRILQEALTNVVRHAQASQVDVTLRTTEKFMMKVQDNGSGLRENSTGRRSLGILGMSERAQQLGGSVTLSGEPGSGATVTLTLPIRQDEGVKTE